MALSKELIKTLEKASIALSNNAQGELTFFYRRQIWASLGPFILEGTYAKRSIGLYRRTRLSILCTQHVLNIWEQNLPESKLPHELLDIAIQYLDNAIDLEIAKELTYSPFCGLESSTNQGTFIYVGYTAHRAVLTALHDEFYDPDESENLEDEDLDVDQWDSSYFASAAYANGFKWEKTSNPTRRREFWEWYLRDAVPAAWEVK